jgi:hypothetical protein
MSLSDGDQFNECVWPNCCVDKPGATECEDCPYDVEPTLFDIAPFEVVQDND